MWIVFQPIVLLVVSRIEKKKKKLTQFFLGVLNWLIVCFKCELLPVSTNSDQIWFEVCRCLPSPQQVHVRLSTSVSQPFATPLVHKKLHGFCQLLTVIVHQHVKFLLLKLFARHIDFKEDGIALNKRNHKLEARNDFCKSLCIDYSWGVCLPLHS